MLRLPLSDGVARVYCSSLTRPEELLSRPFPSPAKDTPPVKAPLSRLVATVGIAFSVGCYHATIETGAPPSSEVISKSFAAGWIYGLVPPSTVATAAKCPDGVSKVETQLSFVNQLVSFLTFMIYTPMNIKVTCAAKRSASSGAPGADIFVALEAGTREIQEAFRRAAELAATTGQPVLVALMQDR